MNKLNFIITTLLSVTLIIACDNNSGPNDRIEFPKSNVSYLEHVQPFIQKNCAYSGCHGQINPAGDRDMTSYFALFDINNVGLIVRNSPKSSRLVQIVDTVSLHMNGLFPRNYFIKDEHNGLLKWIEEGAQNN